MVCVILIIDNTIFKSQSLKIYYQHHPINLQSFEFPVWCIVKMKQPTRQQDVVATSWRRRGDVVTTFLCTSQWRRRYVSNETPNNVSVERRENMSVVGLRGVLLICRDDVSWERNDDVPSVRLHDVSNTSQTANDVSVVRHQDISVVRIYYVPLARHYNVFCNSQMKHPIRSLWYVWTRSWSYVVERPCL